MLFNFVIFSIMDAHVVIMNKEEKTSANQQGTLLQFMRRNNG